MRWFCLITILVVSLTANNPARGDSGWTPFEEVDSSTGTVRKGVQLDDITIWCAKEGRLGKKTLHGRVVAGENVEERRVANEFSSGAGWNEVRIAYRFDQERKLVAGVPRTRDAQGVFLPNTLKHSAKVWAQKMYGASTLTYSIDTLRGEKTATVDLTEGKEHLKAVMDECRVKPKKFKGIGGR